MRISDWSSDVCSSDLRSGVRRAGHRTGRPNRPPGILDQHRRTAGKAIARTDNDGGGSVMARAMRRAHEHSIHGADRSIPTIGEPMKIRLEHSLYGPLAVGLASMPAAAAPPTPHQ